MVPETKEDRRQSCDPRNRPECFRALRAPAPGQPHGEGRRQGESRAPLAKVGNTGPSIGPHLHFGLSDKPDFFTGRALPFVFDSLALIGVIDFDASKGDHLVMTPDSRQVRSAYPLYGSLVDFP